MTDYEAQMRELAERNGYTLTPGRNGTIVAQRGAWRLFASSAKQMCHELQQRRSLPQYENESKSY
jgi:hypothetical protein